MNFKEALIAHLQGEKVESRLEGGVWIDFARDFQNVIFQRFTDYYEDSRFEFRLAPRTIFVNGVEVPAGEVKIPEKDETYFMPHPAICEMFSERSNYNEELTQMHVDRGLVYLNQEDAIARAKAMLLTSDK